MELCEAIDHSIEYRLHLGDVVSDACRGGHEVALLVVRHDEVRRIMVQVRVEDRHHVRVPVEILHDADFTAESREHLRVTELA